MNNKHYVGKQISSFERYDDITITGIALLVDDENEYLAGNDSGYLLEISCPYGTQTMADNLLASLQGKTYRGFRAENASLSPAAELGDGVTVNGVYSLLAYRNVAFGPGHMAEIAAPGEGTLEHEYKWDSPEKREFNRKLAQTRSLISKTAEQIRLEIVGVEEEMSYIQLDLDKITSRVQDAEGNISTLEQTATSLRSDIDGKIDGEAAQSLIDQSLEDITFEVSNDATSSTIRLMAGEAEIDSAKIEFTGVVTFNALSGSPGTGQTTINGGWLTGEVLEGNTIAGGVFTDPKQEYFLEMNAEDGLYGMRLRKTYTPGNFSDTEIITDLFTVYWDGLGTIALGGTNGDFLGVKSDTESTLVKPYGDWDFSYADSVDFGGASASDLRITLSSIGAGTAFLSIERVGQYDSYHVVSNRAIVPEDGSEYPYVGTTEFPWDTMYADSCTCCTSDENRKNSIEDLPDKYLTMFDNLHPKRFKMNNGTSGRFHPGYTAQDVKAAMDIAEVDSTEFGGWIKGTDKDGNDIYMLRYEEFGAIYAAKIKQLEARVAKLEGGKTA